MTKNTNSFLKDRVYFVHDWLIRAGKVVSADQFGHIFSEEAPPIGWHLWHMARFADRLQAKLATVTTGSEAAEIWYRDNISTQWGILASELGVFESGMGQSHQQAQATIVQVGQTAVIDYAQVAFEACDAAVAQLSDTDFDKSFYGLFDYAYDANSGEVWASEPRESVVAQDLIFHATHGSRHMGMMEALRGLLGTAGTLSV